jgi:hypothetical protein
MASFPARVELVMLDTFNKLLNINFDNDFVLSTFNSAFFRIENTQTAFYLNGATSVNILTVANSFQTSIRTVGIDIKSNATLIKAFENTIAKGQRMYINIETGAYTFASDVENATGRYPVEFLCMPVKPVSIEQFTDRFLFGRSFRKFVFFFFFIS